MKTLLKNYYWNLLTFFTMFRRRQLTSWMRYSAMLVDTKFKAIQSPEKFNKNIILLAWEFPPQITGGVYRPASFARYASNAGWNTMVLSGPAPESVTPAGSYIENTIPEAVAVHRISVADKGSIPWLLPNVDGGILNAVAVYEAACKLIGKSAPGIIIATGPPFHNFVAGIWLAKKQGWRLVLDYRDEWTESPHGFNRCDSINHIWESKCLERADRVIFTTHSQLIHQITVFPELKEDKCAVIFNGWEPDDFEQNKVNNIPPIKTTGTEINIAFFGNLGPWWHTEDFLNALKQVLDTTPDLRNDLKVHFIGQKSPLIMTLFNEFPYQNVLKLEAHVSKKEVCQMMKSVDGLLLLNPLSLCRYIPGKTYEYLAAGKPILLFGEGGEMESIIKQLNAGQVVSATEPKALEQALRNIKSLRYTPNKDKTNWLQSRTRQQLAHKMLEVLDALIAPSTE